MKPTASVLLLIGLALAGIVAMVQAAIKL